jgi:hypothetical protein
MPFLTKEVIKIKGGEEAPHPALPPKGAVLYTTATISHVVSHPDNLTQRP